MKQKDSIKISKIKAKQLANNLGINLNVVPLKWWWFGLNVELEHGSKMGNKTNVTHDNLKTTSQITLAHLLETPDYYNRLYKMEKQADNYWKSRHKPNIFIKN